MKIKKKLLTFFNVLAGASILVSLPSLVLSSRQNSFDVSANQVKNINQYVWGGGSSNEDQQISVSFKTKQELENTLELKNFEPKTIDELTANDVKLFLNVTNNVQGNWLVEIIEPTDEQIITGALQFKVFQHKRKSNGEYEKTPIKYTNTTNNQQEEIWYLKNAIDANNGNEWLLKKYVKTKKYDWKWISDEEKELLFNSEKKYSALDLTKDFVLKNLVSYDSILPNHSDIDIQVSDISQDSSKYGTKKIIVSFKGNANNADNWDEKHISYNNRAATVKKQEITLRCLTSSNGEDTNMKIVQRDSSGISNIKISDKNLFGNALSNQEDKIGDLLPSEFVGVVEQNHDNPSSLNDMLLKGKGLDNNPFVEIEYMGIKTTDSDFENKTGLKNSDHKITKIRTIPNDKDGSLQIIYTYDGLNIYKNKIEEKNVIQFLPPSTFKTSDDGNKILNFAWKKVEAIDSIGTSYSFVNQFARNKEEKEFLKSLTNDMFIASRDTYNKDREVEIDYDFYGSSATNSPHEEVVTEDGIFWEARTTDNTEATVRLTFPSWSGATYTDENGNIKEGFKTQKKFKFPSYKIDNFDVIWTTQEGLLSANPTFPYSTPSSIVERISKDNDQKEISQDTFFKLKNSYGYDTDVAFVPDNSNGTIRVLIRVVEQDTTQNKLITKAQFSQVFTGMKANPEISSSSIKEYAWLPISDINQELLGKKIDEVSKSDILELYLKEIPMFKNLELTQDDFEMEIVKSIDSDTSYIEIKVTIGEYNADDTYAERIFINRISGFSLHSSKGDYEVDPPVDSTTIVSIVAATFVTVVLLTILVAMISKRAKLRKFDDLKKLKNKK